MKISRSLKFTAIASASMLLMACNQQPAAAPEAKLNLEDESIKESYAVGFSAGSGMKDNIESIKETGIVLNNDAIIKAFADGLLDQGQMDEAQLSAAMGAFQKKVSSAMQVVQQKQASEQTAAVEENLTKGKAYLADNEVKDGVTALESGLQYKVITQGSGKSPSATDKVSVHYTGTLIDGSKFDSSRDRGEPASFGVNQVIKGWTEALQLMKEGDRWELTIPADLAYGPGGRPSIPGNSVLLFDVELIEVVAVSSPH